MKKTLAIILVAVMLLSTLVSLVVPAAAADEGDWDVLLTAKAAETDPEKNPPLPGYYYDETGFHTVSPDYTNFNPKFTVISKEMYNIQNFSMTIRVHDYRALNDNWLSISLWDTFNGIDQGGTSGKYGGGWTSLIRGDLGDMSLNRTESWNQTIGGRSNKQQFTAIDGTQMAPLRFEQNIDPETGDYIITFSIENGIVKFNGMALGAGTDSCIADYFKSGLAYVAITINNTDNSGEYHPTISILDVNGTTPAGSSSRDPEVKSREYGPMIDSDTVPANTPAIWFDGTLEATNKKLPTGSNCSFDFADDNESMLVTVSDALFYSQFDVPDEISYYAPDFTYIVYVFKNFCTCAAGENDMLYDVCTNAETCNVWYSSGKLTTAGGTCVGPFTGMYNVTPVDEDMAYIGEDLYTVGVLAISHEEWVDRINAIRLDVSGYTQFGNPDRNTFEIMGAGVFRSGADIVGFLSEFRGLGLYTDDIAFDLDQSCDHFDWDEDGLCDLCFEDMSSIGEETTEESTETPTENNGSETPSETETVEVPTENGSEASSEDASAEVPSENNTADAGEAEVTTDKKDEATTAKKDEATTKADSSDDAGEAKKGCKSSVAMGALAIVAIVGTGLVAKKKED